MENRDKKSVGKSATLGTQGVILKKNTKKMMKMLHAGVILNIQKEIKYSGFPFNTFLKNVQISPIYKGPFINYVIKNITGNGIKIHEYVQNICITYRLDVKYRNIVKIRTQRKAYYF